MPEFEQTRPGQQGRLTPVTLEHGWSTPEQTGMTGTHVMLPAKSQIDPGQHPAGFVVQSSPGFRQVCAAPLRILPTMAANPPPIIPSTRRRGTPDATSRVKSSNR
ncbi:MAG TPA: hypothetical protein VEQ36_04000 [Thermomicrobiales bacterium]|nr:hypothetical protein [Thermomicrobiales bacterium]